MKEMKDDIQDKDKEVGKQSERETGSQAAMNLPPLKSSTKFSSCLAAEAVRQCKILECSFPN